MYLINKCHYLSGEPTIGEPHFFKSFYGYPCLTNGKSHVTACACRRKAQISLRKKRFVKKHTRCRLRAYILMNMLIASLLMFF